MTIKTKGGYDETRKIKSDKGDRNNICHYSPDCRPGVGRCKKGQKYYLKSFKAKFAYVSGARFAAEHSQEEWEELFEDNGKLFTKEYGEKYPKSAKYLQNPKTWKKLEHVRDFVIEYANDSGNVPSCG